QFSRSVCYFTPWFGSDEDRLIARLVYCGVDPGNCSVHPVTYGTISIMVIRVHIRSLKRTIRFNAVPSFPNRRGPHFYRIKPGGVTLLKQKIIRHIIMPKSGQYMT